MEGSMKEACFEEITHLICDADKKVNITDVSNNWNLSHRDSETILLEWIKKNEKQPLNKEFLIRGVEKNGNCVITVLPEIKLDAVQRKFEQFYSSLYSIELASESNSKRLNVAKLSDCKVINLPLKRIQRDVVVKPLPIPEDTTTLPTTSKKNIQSMFAANKSAVKSEIKHEITSPETTSLEKTSSDKKDIKSEKETPKKQSPKKKEVAKTPKASGKSAITSFFSKPSTKFQSQQNHAVKKETIKPTIMTQPSSLKNNSSDMFDQSSMEVDQKEETVIDTKPKELAVKKDNIVKNNKKRTITDVHENDDEDEIPNTPQDSKKAKRSVRKVAEKSKKHSRIMKIDDSSDEDDIHNEQVKLLSSPVKEKENKTPPKSDFEKVAGGRLRRKAKKTVAQTVTDEEGYLVTTNVVVDYSCSEEENEVVPVEPIKQVKEVSATEPSSEELPKKKKISPPKAGAKQGSILNFFSKK